MSMLHIQHLFSLSSKIWKVAHLSLQCSNKSVCVFLLATYTDGQPTENAEWFCKWLEEASTDFRYGKTYLKGLRCAMFGLGNSVYGSHYNMNVDKWLWMLSGICVLSRGDSNCKVVKTHNGSAQADFLVWKTKFLNCMQALVAGQKKACSGNCKTDGSCKTRNRKKPQEKTEDDQAYPEQLSSEEVLVESSSDEETTGSEVKDPGSVIDVENLGNMKAKAIQTQTILWRKRRLCMETTSSIACANKCVFCWRWVQLNYDCWCDGFRDFRIIHAPSGMHSTLSLVGEPIMYPKMNAFLYLLHTHRVSGFIVTDAQFPQEIRWGYCSYDEDISKYQPPSPLSPSLPVPLSLQGVTYCGESHPFVQQLADMLPNYQIACKHEHSNCLHIVHTKVAGYHALLLILSKSMFPRTPCLKVYVFNTPQHVYTHTNTHKHTSSPDNNDIYLFCSMSMPNGFLCIFIPHYTSHVQSTTMFHIYIPQFPLNPISPETHDSFI
uniref:tRNA-yW synthesizing protein 1 homolog (S. cerevisiae) n=1 Tax=Oncorhynchus kisutch TaxID=8019 RepID=A0A8C7D837_ONCKI